MNPVQNTDQRIPTAALPQHKESLGQKDFLKLMVAQIKNQDPMDPKTNGDFMAQLAQFSATDGIGKIQKSLEQLTSSLQSNQALQASSLVGRKVMVKSNVMSLGKEGGAKGAVEVPKGVKDLTVSIFTPQKELVKTIKLDPGDKTLNEFNWDGTNSKGQRVNPGDYNVQITGSYQGKEYGFHNITSANVDSVTLGQNGEGVLLNLPGIGSVSVNDVIKITN